MAEPHNFYVLIGLDPEVDDWPSIEAALQAKRVQWSKDSVKGDVASKRKAQYFLGLVTEITAALKDPEQRREQAALAKKLRAEARADGRKRLLQLAQMLKEGVFTPEQLVIFVDQLAGVLTEPEIVRELNDAGFRPAAMRSAETSTERPCTDAAVLAQIAPNLQTLGLESLYGLLELGPQSSARLLCERADELYKQNLGSNRTDAKASAESALAGFAKAVFATPADKEKYDNALAIEAMNRLKPEIELAGAAARYLTRDDVDRLVTLARAGKVAPALALAFIHEHARKRKWSVQSGERPAAEERRLCGSCWTVAPAAGASHCAKCGEALTAPCPRCGAAVPTEQSACGQCGVHVGDGVHVRRLMKQGERLTVEGDLVEAIRIYERVLLTWPNWKSAVEARKAAEARRAGREAALSEVETLVSTRRLVEAARALERFRRQHGAAGTDALEHRLKAGLEATEAAYREAEAHLRAGRNEQALAKIEEALALCVDHGPARDTLARNPPPPPEDLRVMPLAGGWRLTWKPGPGGGRIMFRVVRRRHIAPLEGQEAHLVAETGGTTVDDVPVEEGCPWHYAIFALRCGVSSSALRAGPHLLAGEVTDLELLPGDGEMALRWRRPPGCRRVEVWREARGLRTAVIAGPDSATDPGLVNGTRCGWRVVALYDDPGRPGELMRSQGVVREAAPAAPPAPVSDLRVARTDSTVVLTFGPVAGARVLIRQCTTRPPTHVGQVMTLDAVEALGNAVARTSETSAQAALDTQGRVWFVPFSVVGDLAVAGAPQEVTTVDDVSDLRSRIVGRNILLSWTWPRGATEAHVSYDYQTCPHDPTAGIGARITLAQYQRAGGFELFNAERRTHYFTVFVRSADAWSSGKQWVEAFGRTTPVSYRVVLDKSLLTRKVRDAHVELKSESHVVLPALVVVCRRQTVPTGPQDGELIAEVPGLSLSDGCATIRLPASHFGTPNFVKVFFRDPAQVAAVRLMPAAQEQLRLS